MDLSADEKVKRAFYLKQGEANRVHTHTHTGLHSDFNSLTGSVSAYSYRFFGYYYLLISCLWWKQALVSLLAITQRSSYDLVPFILSLRT